MVFANADTSIKSNGGIKGGYKPCFSGDGNRKTDQRNGFHTGVLWRIVY
jgi:hypothetical protein